MATRITLEHTDIKSVKSLAFPFNIRIIGIAAFIILGAYIGIARPFEPGLGQQGHLTLMAIIIALGLWIFASKWLPFAAGSMTLLMLLLVSGLDYGVVFNGFTTRAIWILIPALYFGFALSKTGLGKRIAYRILGFFKPSYLTLTISWVIIGLLLSVFTPSITVRIAIMIPLAVAAAEICKLRYGARGAGFIVLTAWAMAIIPGSGWLTGSLWGPMALGYFNSTPGLEGAINFGSWLKGMLLPTALISTIFIAGTYIFLRPKENLNVDRDAFISEYAALGPMSLREKATLAILLVTFLLLVTSQMTGLPDVGICIGAFALLVAFRIIRANDIGQAISWDLVLFLGTAMGLGLILRETGVAAFLNAVFNPVISLVAANPWILLFLVLSGLLIWRFLDITQLYATIPFMLPFLPMLATDFGINPLVMYMIFIIAGNFFFLAYQQPFAILGQSLAGESAWSAKQLRQAGIIYALASLVTLAVTIPYWMAVGYIR